MPFSMIKNATLMLAICLFCSACANDNRWKVNKTYDSFERMLVQAQNDSSTKQNDHSMQLERNKKSYSFSEGKYINTAFDIENNTVFVLTKNDVGSGFFIAPGIIITNKHVVRKNTRVIVFSKNLGTPQLAVVKALSVGKYLDFALLKMVKENYGPMGLAMCAKIEVGEKVSTLGFPLKGLESDPRFKRLQAGDPNAIPAPIYSSGIIKKSDHNVITVKSNLEYILHTADISHGNSGSPLTNSDYCVVGINTYVHIDKKTKMRTSIALGSEDIAAFLKKNGIKPLSYQP